MKKQPKKKRRRKRKPFSIAEYAVRSFLKHAPEGATLTITKQGDNS